MILIISTCKEPLSELEFVRPLEGIVKKAKVVHYKRLRLSDVKSADKIIISGTALKDFEYLDHDWSWLKDCDKPVLGICAGLHVIGKAFELPIISHFEIGVQQVETVNENKLCEGTFNAYFLHTRHVEGLAALATSNGAACIVKHPEKEIYGCIFHPEVMNEKIISNFTKTI